jgi:hypothetical protein
MKRLWVPLGVLLLLLLNTGASHGLAAEERHLVLVTASASKITPLSPTEIRKLFLGLPISQNSLRLEPVHNASDPLLNEVFLQKIIFMSARSYDHQLMSQVFRSGGHRPLSYNDADALAAALRDKPGTLSYMWSSGAQQIPGIKVVQELWQGPVD